MDPRLPRRSFVAAAALAPLTFPGFALAQEGPSRNEEVVRLFYQEVLAFDGDLNAIGELLSPDFIAQDATDISDRVAYKVSWADARKALREQFTEWRWNIDDLVVNDDRVAVRGTITGIRRSTEDVTTAAAMFFAWFVLENGRIVELWSLSEPFA